jgi:hypothetical protein
MDDHANVWSQRIAKVPACIGLELIATAVVVELHAWRWPWVQAVSHALGKHLILVMLGLPALALLTLSVVRPHRRPHATGAAPPVGASRWPWLLADRGLLTVAGALVGVGLFALVAAASVSSLPR